MTLLVILTVVDIVLLIAGLAFYLYWVGSLLTRIATNLEECGEIVRSIVGHAELIGPGVEHINATGGVVAGALPLLDVMGGEGGARAHYRPGEAATPYAPPPGAGHHRRRRPATGLVPPPR